MTNLGEVKDRIIGKVGTPRRDKFEKELKEELAPFREAKQLVNSFMPWVTALYSDKDKKQVEYYFHIAKECALVTIKRVENALLEYAMTGGEIINLDLVYWEKVRMEIYTLELSQL